MCSGIKTAFNRLKTYMNDKLEPVQPMSFKAVDKRSSLPVPSTLAPKYKLNPGAFHHTKTSLYLVCIKQSRYRIKRGQWLVGCRLSHFLDNWT